MQRRILLASLLIFVMQLSNAQDACVFDSISPAPELGKICDLAFPICISELNGFSASIEKDTSFDQTVTACAPFSYVDWYSFNYCGDTLKIGITPNNCTDGVDSTGLFAGLYSGCSDAELLLCDGTTTDGEEIVLELIGPNIGNVRLFVDGYSSSMCDYTIQVYHGLGDGNSDIEVLNCEEKVVGQAESCQGGVLTYSAELICEDSEGNASSNACQGMDLLGYGYDQYSSDICYEWTITPEEGWEIIGDQNGPTINIKWFNEDSLYATNPDTFLIQRRTLSNPYFDERFGLFCVSTLMNIDYAPLQVIVNPPVVNQYEVEICEGESYEFFGEILTESGQYTWLDTSACVLDVLDLFVKPSGINEIVDVISRCPGACITYEGMEFCQEGEFVVDIDECQNTKSIEVIDGFLDVNLVADNMINCINQTTVISALVETDINNTGLNYIWFHGNDVVGEGTTSIIVTQGGEYSVLVSLIDDYGTEMCNVMESIVVDENFDVVDIQVLEQYVWNCNTTQLNLNALFDNDIAGSVLWTSNDGSVVQGATSGSLTISSPGQYNIEVTHKISGCVSGASIDVQEIQGINDVDFSSTSISCALEPADIIINNVSGGTPPYIYYMDNEIIQQNSKVYAPGVYSCKVVDDNGCDFEFEVEIEGVGQIEGNVLGELEVFSGEDINLEADYVSSLDSTLFYEWYLSDGSLISNEDILNITVYQDEVITLVVSGVNNCSIEKEISIKVRKRDAELYFPNSFSPNGDGINDFFKVYSNKWASGAYKLNVYDRWGNVVYVMNDNFNTNSEKGWDGRNSKGEEVLTGTYVYTLVLNTEDGDITRVGTILVLR